MRLTPYQSKLGRESEVIRMENAFLFFRFSSSISKLGCDVFITISSSSSSLWSPWLIVVMHGAGLAGLAWAA